MKKHLPVLVLLLLLLFQPRSVNAQLWEPVGNVDAYSTTSLTGWACDGDDYSQPVTVRFYVGSYPGGYVGETVANLIYPSAALSCGGFGSHGFTFTFPTPVQPGQLVIAYALNLPLPGNGSAGSAIWSYTYPAVSPSPTPSLVPTPSPGSSCAASASTPVNVRWSWQPVAGANQYQVDILNSNGTVIIHNDWQYASVYSCASGGTCVYTTPLLTGSYYSRVAARNNIGGCVDSGFAQSPTITIPLCTGTIQARAVVVTDPQTTCPYVRTSTTYIDGTTFGFSAPGGITPQNQSATTHYATFSNMTVGSYTIAPQTPAGYIRTSICWNSSTGASGDDQSTASLPSNGTLTFTTGFTTYHQWVQFVGGSVKVRRDWVAGVGGSIDLQVPSMQTLLKDDPTQNQNSPLVSYENLFDIGAGSVSTEGYLVKDGDQIIPASFSYYNYYYNRFGTKTRLNSGAVAPVSGVYEWQSPGDLTIRGTWNIPSGSSVIIFVPQGKNVVIDTNITVADGGFLAIIARNNLIVNDTVGYLTPVVNPNKITQANVSGIFIVDGNFKTNPTAGSVDRQLILSGTFVAGSFTLQRDLEVNNTNPGEMFIFRPDLWAHAPSELKEIDVTWEEIAP